MGRPPMLLTRWSTLTVKSDGMAEMSSLFLCACMGRAGSGVLGAWAPGGTGVGGQQKWGSGHTRLPQEAVGLLVEESDLVGARMGALVVHAPGYLGGRSGYMLQPLPQPCFRSPSCAGSFP